MDKLRNMKESIIKLLNSSVLEDRLIALELAGFISSNGLKMIEGIRYNWQLKYKYRDDTGPISLFIFLGGMGEYKQVMWHLSEGHNLIFSETRGGLALHCEGIEEAEKIVISYIKANNIDLSGTIYEKL